MKRMKKLFYTFLSMCLLLLMAAPVPVSAKEEEYTYTVRFFSGKQGSFSKDEMLVFEGLRYGDRINFYQNAVTLNDNSKYYIRGIRESGKDNSDSSQASSFVVTGDKDYVIAYGILGDATTYTINYIDRDGNALVPSETYYGNVGDRPVVAYIYIEGWTPEAYNMTQTLKKDPAENVFNFVYTREEEAPAPAPAPEAPAPAEPETPPEPEAPAPVITDTPGIDIIPAEETPLGNGPGGAGGAGAGNTPGGGGNEQFMNDSQIPTGNAPQEVVDMDEDDTPLSNFLSVAADARLLGIPLPVVLIIALGMVGIAWYFLILKRNKEEKSKVKAKRKNN